MLPAPDQILTVVQMQAAERALIDAGTSVEALMRTAGRGAGEWVWRISGGRPVTVLCGPGNNGGDGWVLAELIRERGGDVAVISPREPGTDAARDARAKYGGAVLPADTLRHGEVFIDCLFGSGLNRALPTELVELLARLARSHHHAVAVDLASGVESDSGELLNDGLPQYDLTVALGAWKFAHWTLPAMAPMGPRRLVGIGCAAVADAARLLGPPRLEAPAVDAHKYSRGLLAIVAGALPGAAQLAAQAAMHGGAGYVKLLGAVARPAPDLVVDDRALDDALGDRRITALLAGPGLGRDAEARVRLEAALRSEVPTVLDADALVLLRRDDAPLERAVLTPHSGELQALERAFGLSAEGPRRDRALALARTTGAVVLLKGADSLVAAPDGELVCAPPASSWLSVAGSGDVLAGLLASRLAVHREPLRAAEEALWLHGEAARQAGVAFSAGQLADAVQGAIAAALA
jgi:ADP-dependent NAD(P)H-hydrate dehydratase / NAD(P)H-hydrate epimerase